jgi:Tfp pilus assembly protein PilF
VWKAARSAGFLVLLVPALLAISTLGQTQPHSAANGHIVRPTASESSRLKQAEVLIQQGHPEDAKKIIEAELLSNPSSVEAYNLQGIIFTDEKDYAHAIDAFQQALKLAPNSTKTHNNLGNLYVTQQKLDLAEEEFAKVLRIAPANRDANYNLGLLLLSKGKPVEAIQHFQRVHPATVETRFNLVRAYFQSGKTAEALQTAHEISTMHKQDVQLHFTLGVLLAAAKQYKAAELELEQANALQP